MTRWASRTLHLASLLPIALLVGACASSTSSESMSDSSGSISESFVSPFESSSDSSGRENSAYFREVESLTVASVEANGSAESFLADLGRTAAAHGIADWEALATTYRGVGAGLRRAGQDADEASAFAQRIFGANPEVRAWLLEGYRS